MLFNISTIYSILRHCMEYVVVKREQKIVLDTFDKTKITNILPMLVKSIAHVDK